VFQLVRIAVNVYVCNSAVRYEMDATKLKNNNFSLRNQNVKKELIQKLLGAQTIRYKSSLKYNVLIVLMAL